VLYHDDYLVLVNKPSGLLSVKGIGINKIDCLAVRVASAIEGARIVHRLDMDTSGVLVMARDADTHRELSRQFQDREVEKTYIAEVFGQVEEQSGLIDYPIRKDMDNPPMQCVDYEQGKPSQTLWRVLEQKGDRARLELRPTTGRSHQLRIHLREIGHPILGDDLYAPSKVQAMSERLLLHALSLTITHPKTGNRLTSVADCPF
jgi:tRNA pseudouridine32 synthase/23S rRNA pseudouridine746 synthase|tara:strand:+ start:272 stop:883 length:612 start_codon:yes stop_codon:yes gene_type:complete